MPLIPDPADRLTDEFVAAVTSRYATPASFCHAQTTPERFAEACDLAVQLLWPEKYGTDLADPHRHTSDPARRIAWLFCVALGVNPDSNTVDARR